MPGETAYEVIGADGKPLEPQAALNDPRRRRQDRADGLVDDRRGSRCELAGNPPAARAGAGRPVDGPKHRRRRPTSETPHGRPRPASTRPTRLIARPARAAPPAASHAVGHRCPCGNPDVVTTEPRLPNGTPFPTTYYLTCPRAASRIGTLEGIRADAGDAGAARRGRRSSPRPTARRTSAYLDAAPRWRTRRARRPRDRGHLAPAACPTGSSACTCSPASRSPRAAASTRSATRCSTGSATGGPRVRASSRRLHDDRVTTPEATSPPSTAAPTRSSS